MNRPATQDWVHGVSIMQQSVLLSAIRGCDGMPKFHKHKALVKWYRRCVLISAFDGVALTDPFAPGGGSFTGPIADLRAWRDAGPHPVTEYDHRCSLLQKATDDFMDSRDELPAHYRDHFMHAAEVVGYKHPDPTIREFWFDVYERLVHALHVWPETEAQMDARLGDNFAGWKARGDVSSSCSD
jgi:hypothetical protein